MTPGIVVMPESAELGRSSDIIEDSRWCRELLEYIELVPSLSAARYWPSLAVLRLSALFFDLWKKDEALPPEEALDLSLDDMSARFP